MVEVPDVGAIVKQIRARISHIEEQLRQHGDLSDELERLRDALGRLESGVSARVRGGARAPAKTRARKPTAPAGKTASASKTATTNKAATTKRPSAARTPRRAAAAPRGQTRAKILQALKDGPTTAGEIADATGINRGTASTTLTKLAKTGEVVKAERGYKLPE
jgi:DNA-binding transcriptional ArsR family regulator